MTNPPPSSAATVDERPANSATHPTPPKRSNGPGLAALIFGIVALVVAVIPFANLFAFVLGPVGIICGVIGLVLAHRPRRAAIWGTVLSGVAMVVAVILFFVYSLGFLSAVGESAQDLPGATQSAASGALPNPSAVNELGTVVELPDAAGEPAYEATVTVSVLDATDQVLGNARNIEAPAGMQWAMARITATSLSPLHTAVATDIRVEYVSPDGQAFGVDDEYVIAPEPEFALLPAIAVGETTTGNVAIAIPIEDVADGYWALSYVDADTGVQTEPFYFAIGQGWAFLVVGSLVVFIASTVEWTLTLGAAG